jgi:lipopolysaccharide export LptBFGC system permease protein LptF
MKIKYRMPACLLTQFPVCSIFVLLAAALFALGLSLSHARRAGIVTVFCVGLFFYVINSPVHTLTNSSFLVSHPTVL